MRKTLYSLSFIFFCFLIYFSPLLLKKSIYPFANSPSVRSSGFVDNNLANKFQSNLYMDHGASDWIEIPLNSINSYIVNEKIIPLWNPYSSIGMPLLANITTSFLSPFYLHLIVWNTELGWNIAYVIRLLFAVIFSYLFFRRLKLSHFPSTLGALLYGFNGYSSLYLNIFHFNVDAMLPFLLWSGVKFCESKTPLSSFLFVIGIISLIFGGNPQNITLVSIFVIGFLIVYSASNFSISNAPFRLKNSLVLVFYIASSFIIAIGITYFYWYPFIELFYSSLHPLHINAGTSSLPTESLLGLIYPFFRSQPDKAFLFIPYIGFFTLPIIFLGLDFKTNKNIKIYILCVILILLLKAIGKPDFFNQIGNLPVLRNIAFWKYLSPFFFSISILFAFSLDRLSSNSYNFRNYKIYLISGYTILGFLFLIFLNIKSGFFNYWVLFQSLCFLVFIILSGLILKKQISRNKIIYFSIFILIELLVIRLSTYSNLPPLGHAFREPNFVTYIKSTREQEYDRIFGTGSVLMGDLASLYKIHDIRGTSPTLDSNYFNFMKELILKNNLDIQNETTTSSKYYPEGKKYLDLLGVNYLVFDDCKFHRNIPGSKLIYTENCLTVYKNMNAFKRAFVAYNYERVESSDILSKLNKYDSNKLHNTIILEEGNKDYFLSKNKLLHKATVEILSYLPNTVEISVKTLAPGFLVLTDLYYPGWNVYVDNVESQTLRVNSIFRGVYIESGNHIISFKYEPIYIKYIYPVLFIFLALFLILIIL